MDRLKTLDAGGKPGVDHAFKVNDANPDVTHAMHHHATLSCKSSGVKMTIEST
jgi:hypothetical protein